MGTVKPKGVWNAFLKVLFPERITCDICGAELVADTRYNLCASCSEKLPLNFKKICQVCGTPIYDEADYCIRCQNTESKFEKNRSPLSYEDEAIKLISMLKFGGKKYLADTLSALMADACAEHNLYSDVIAFVPMTADEKKKRGFNQAELLANAVGKRLNIEVVPALIKVRDTSVQKKLTARERAKNLEGAFLANPEHIKQKTVLLIDDVFTTGSTANECAKALLKAKATRIFVLTAAVTKQKILTE